MSTWELKTWPEYFQAVRSGQKTFEARVCEDKNFAVGDKLVLLEFVRGVGYTGEVLAVIVTYVLLGGEFGIRRGYCVMSIRLAEKARLVDQIQELNSQIATLEYQAGEAERCHPQVITDATFPVEQKNEKLKHAVRHLINYASMQGEEGCGDWPEYEKLLEDK